MAEIYREIYTAEDFLDLCISINRGDYTNSANVLYVTIENDLDMNDLGGEDGTPFNFPTSGNGTSYVNIDGKNHTISNLSHSVFQNTTFRLFINIHGTIKNMIFKDIFIFEREVHLFTNYVRDTHICYFSNIRIYGSLIATGSTAYVFLTAKDGNGNAPFSYIDNASFIGSMGSLTGSVCAFSANWGWSSVFITNCTYCVDHTTTGSLRFCATDWTNQFMCAFNNFIVRSSTGNTGDIIAVLKGSVVPTISNMVCVCLKPVNKTLAITNDASVVLVNTVVDETLEESTGCTWYDNSADPTTTDKTYHEPSTNIKDPDYMYEHYGYPT